ncbi:MAG: glycosyltransferase [Chitinophagia bacterium]|jgi:glycosyltransferase involved in cell wall biosynthesis
MVNKLVIIGPAWPLRGGLSAFDETLATHFSNQGINTRIDTFSIQYPSFLFPGTSQYSSEPQPKNVNINVCINSINPLNWIKIGLKLYREKPELIIVRYWIPFLAPCLGTILFITKRNKHTKVISIVDNMIPHEKRIGDHIFTTYFSKMVDGFIAMSEKVKLDIRLFSHKPITVTPHPIFNQFGNSISKQSAREILGIPQDDKIILFFGYIRKYKGLDLLLQAMSNESIKKMNIKLMIVGEYYDDEAPYQSLISSLGLQEQVMVYANYIPDAEVKNYVCSADFIIQPYKTATQSGVTPMAYHFEKPMLVTNVGGLADTVPHMSVGIVVEPNAEAIGKGIVNLYELGADYFIPNIIEEKKKYTWTQMTEKFLALYQQL